MNWRQLLGILGGRPDAELERRVVDRTCDRLDPTLFVFRRQHQPACRQQTIVRIVIQKYDLSFNGNTFRTNN